MTETMLIITVLLVAIPACAGAYIVACYYGSKRTVGGGYLLTFATVSAIGIIVVPNSSISTASVLLFLLAALAAGSLVGLFWRRSLK